MLCKWGTMWLNAPKTKLLWQLLFISNCCSLFPTVLAVWHLIMKMKLTLLLITSCQWWHSHLISRNTGIWTRIIIIFIVTSFSSTLLWSREPFFYQSWINSSKSIIWINPLDWEEQNQLGIVLPRYLFYLGNSAAQLLTRWHYPELKARQWNATAILNLNLRIHGKYI